MSIHTVHHGTHFVQNTIIYLGGQVGYFQKFVVGFRNFEIKIEGFQPKKIRDPPFYPHYELVSGVDGGPSGGSTMRRPGSEEPIGTSKNVVIGPSEAGATCGANLGNPLLVRAECCRQKQRWPLF